MAAIYTVAHSPYKLYKNVCMYEVFIYQVTYSKHGRMYTNTQLLMLHLSFCSNDEGPAWQKTVQPIAVHPFTAPVGPAVPISASILETFNLFFTTALVRLIVEQTNLYAAHALCGMSERAATSWKDVTESDILAFLGFAILMGVNQLPAMVHYWRKDPTLRYSPIADRISRDRFTEIWRFLHFVDNTTLSDRSDPNYDRLGKIRPVISAVQELCRMNYHGSRDQSIDEAVIAFKGRSSMKQYMPMKPTKRGFKVWVRADNENGYVCQFECYTAGRYG